MLNFEGLRKRQSYNEVVHYIQAEQPKLKYPNRRASFLVNSPQYSSLLELDGMDEQEEEIKKAHVMQSLGPTLLAQHIEKSSVGSGPGESVFNMGKHGPEPAPPATSAAAAADAVMHGPEPAPPKKTIMSYFTSGKKAPPASSASASASASVPAAALPPPSAQDVQALAQKAANFAQASKPAVFQIFGQDDEDFHSGEEEEDEDVEEMEEDDDDSLARELADALAQHDREEAEREKEFADQVKDHLDGVSQQGTPLAHSRAQSVATQRSPSPTKPAAIPVAQVERSESQPVRRRIRGKSSDPKATYTETPGASSSGAQARGRSRDPKATTNFKAWTISSIDKLVSAAKMREYLKARGVSIKPNTSSMDMALYLKQFDQREFDNRIKAKLKL